MMIENQIKMTEKKIEKTTKPEPKDRDEDDRKEDRKDNKKLKTEPKEEDDRKPDKEYKKTKAESREDDDRKPDKDERKENRKTTKPETKEMRDEERELAKEEQRKENRKTSIDPDRKDYRKTKQDNGQLGMLTEEKLEKLERLEAAHRLKAKEGKATINATLLDESDRKVVVKHDKDSESDSEDENMVGDTSVIGYNLRMFGRKEIISNKDNNGVILVTKEWHPSKPYAVGRTQFKKLPGEVAFRMSRKHFEINCSVSNKTGKRHFILTDTSGNGTYINGKIVGNGNSKVLKDGDKIEVVLAKDSKDVELGYEFEINEKE